jgi:four helix bundle protein
MGPARHYSDLIVWKLAEEIRIKVFGLTDKPAFAADLRARSQAEDAVNSICRNIAEGFGCETHAEFARFLEISRRSLNELHDILHGARLKKYVSAAELAPIRGFATRLYPAFSRFIAYLKRTPTARPRRGGPDSGVGANRRRQGARGTESSDTAPMPLNPPRRSGRLRIAFDARTNLDLQRGAATIRGDRTDTDKDRDRTDDRHGARTDKRRRSHRLT